MADYAYNNDIDDGLDSEIVEMYHSSDEEAFDTEKLLHTFSEQDLSLIVLKGLGYTPKEIVKIMHLHNINSYYMLRTQLKKSFLIRKYLIESKQKSV